MEKTIDHYKKCIKQLLAGYESLRTNRTHVDLIFDDERMHYMAVRVGWAKRKRIHLCLVHIDICNGLIVIHCNNTEDIIVDELEKMGISRQQVRIAFLPPEVQAAANYQESELTLELA